jgi:hypothetical protein
MSPNTFKLNQALAIVSLQGNKNYHHETHKIHKKKRRKKRMIYSSSFFSLRVFAASRGTS